MNFPVFGFDGRAYAEQGKVLNPKGLVNGDCQKCVCWINSTPEKGFPNTFPYFRVSET